MVGLEQETGLFYRKQADLASPSLVRSFFVALFLLADETTPQPKHRDRRLISPSARGSSTSDDDTSVSRPQRSSETTPQGDTRPFHHKIGGGG